MTNGFTATVVIGPSIGIALSEFAGIAKPLFASIATKIKTRNETPGTSDGLPGRSCGKLVSSSQAGVGSHLCFLGANVIHYLDTKVILGVQEIAYAQF